MSLVLPHVIALNALEGVEARGTETANTEYYPKVNPQYTTQKSRKILVKLTIGRDHTNVTSLGGHVGDGKPLVLAHVVALDAFEGIARCTATAHTENNAYWI